MKKKVLMKIFLVLLPAMAVLLATTGDSVKVYDILAGTIQSYSYFDLLPVPNMQIITVLAALLAVAALVLALIYVIAAKQWCVKGVFYTACASTCVAVLPNLLRQDIMVVPNVLLPILMVVLCFLAHAAGKRKEEKPTGPRLG